VASWFCFVPPYYPLRLEGSGFVALLVFTLFGGAIVAIAHEPNVTVERLLAERRRSEILLAQSTRAEQKLAQLNRELLAASGISLGWLHPLLLKVASML
jgi:hypothetical protein